MKKNEKHNPLVYWFLIIINLVYSCQTEDFYLDEEEIYTINGIISPCFQPVIQISPPGISYHAGPSPEDNANVLFYENGKSLGSMEFVGDGYYRFPGFYPSSGQKYKIVANIDGKELNANFEIPRGNSFSVNMNDAYTAIRTTESYNKYTNVYYYNTDTAYYLDFNLEISTNSDMQEYFRLQVLYKNPSVDSMLTYYYGHMLYFENMRPELYFNGGGAFIMTNDSSNYNPCAMFKSNDIINPRIELKSIVIGNPIDSYVYVCLFSLSKKYYNYIKKIAEYLQFEDFDVEGEEAKLNVFSTEGMPSYEPIIFPSNVKNGAGLVTGLTLTVDSFKIEDVLSGRVEEVFYPYEED